MDGPAVGMARFARGLALSGACLALSLFAHVQAGGQVHLGVEFVAAGTLLSVFCVVAAGRRASVGGIAAVVGISQVLLHLFAGMSAHHLGAAGSAAATTATAPALEMSERMLGAHLVAGAVMTGLLAQGERAVWVLYALLGRLARIPRWSPPSLTGPLPARPVVEVQPASPAVGIVVGAVGTRGPPRRMPASATA